MKCDYDKRCCSVESGAIVQREENKKIFRLVNASKKKISVCRVDGCLIDDKDCRCDFMFVVEGEALFLVEMKGTAHVHALRQIINAAEKLGVSAFSGEKKCAIVSPPCPKAASVYQNELFKQRKRFAAIGLGLPHKKNNLIVIEV